MRRLESFALISLSLLVVLPGAGAVELVEPPTLTMNPNARTPLTGVVELVTDQPVAARLAISDGTESWTLFYRKPATEHYLPVLGLKPDRTYTVHVSLAPGGNVGTLFATTPPLPADFPAIVTNVSDPSAMEPGFTWIDCMRRSNNDPRASYTAIVDASGEVVWYTNRCIQAARALPTGEFYFSGGNGKSVIVSDYLDNQVATQLDDPGIRLHHDMLLTPHAIYARFISDADWQPLTGNRLITFGGTGFVGGVSSADLGLGDTHARLIETTRDGTPVFDLTVYDPEGGRIAVYRSERIRGLYPRGVLQRPPGIGN